MKDEIKLGDKVKDTITGYSGVCTAIITFLNGCRRIGIQGKGLDKNNLPVDPYYVDETTVVLVKKQVEKTKQAEKGGANFCMPKFQVKL